MSDWQVQLHRQAVKDLERVRQAGLEEQVRALIGVLREDPFRTPPSFEKLTGDLKGLYSRRINRQHRLVYGVDAERRLVRVLALWTHYER